MASKYINAIVTPYRKVTICEEAGTILSLSTPLTAIHSVVSKDGKIFLPRVDIVTDLTFMGATDEDCSNENPVCGNQKLDMAIRLTRCADALSKTVFVDLDAFTIDLAKVRAEGKLERSCWEFYNYTRLTKVMGDAIQLPDTKEGKPAYGSYVLKVIAKECGSKELFAIQGVAHLEILEPL